MPPAQAPPAGAMFDSWGRSRNRKHPDRACKECGATFRPHRATSSYCSRPCAWKNNGGRDRKPECWWTNSRGYVEGRIWDGDTCRRVKKHRYVVEQRIGRRLRPDEDVHHKNGVKSDNRDENLVLVSHADHSQHHNRTRIYKRGYKLDLSPEDRKRRADRMRAMRAAAIAKAKGR